MAHQGTKLIPIRTRARNWGTRYVSDPVARMLLAIHISANVVTVAGFLVSVVAAYMIADGRLIVGGLVMFAGSIMDMFDGAVARMSGTASKFGAFLDSVLDRLSEAVILFGLMIFYVRQLDELGILLVFGTTVLSVMVSYSRARAEGLGITGDVGIMGRPERITVLGVGLLFQHPQYAMGVILAVSGLTIVQRTLHVLRNSR